MELNIHLLPKRKPEPTDRALCSYCGGQLRYEGRWDEDHSSWNCDRCDVGVCSPDEPIFPEVDSRCMDAARAVWEDLDDRRGIQLGPFEDEIIEKILKAMSYIIARKTQLYLTDEERANAVRI